MSNRLIGGAVIAALASTAAQALPPTSTAQFTVYAAGGSAQAQAALWAMIQMVNTNVDYYTDGACGTQSTNYRIVFGQNSAAIGPTGASQVPAGSNILIYYKFNGGSFPNGIAPQALGSQLAYPPIGTAVACTGATGTNPTYNIPSGFTAVNAVPDWGLSDEEVALFNVTDNVPGATPANVLTPTQVANIAQDGIYDNLFGIAVTNNLFAGTHPKTSFTKAEIAYILAGTATNWNQFFADDGTQLTAGPIVLLDRGPGSGSKAAGNQYFLNYPGGSATSGALTPGNVTFGATGTLCDGAYDDINEASNQAIADALVTANGNATTCRAIAVLGLEYPPALAETPSAVGKYEFVKIGGVFPDATGPFTGTTATPSGLNGATSTGYENVISGAYDFYVQNSFNNRTKAVGANAQHFFGDGTPYSTMIGQIRTYLQSANVVGCSSSANAPSGVLLDPDITTTSTAGRVRGTRVKHTTAPLQILVDATAANATCTDTL